MAQVFKVSRSGYYRYINKKTSLTKEKTKNLLVRLNLSLKIVETLMEAQEFTLR